MFRPGVVCLMILSGASLALAQASRGSAAAQRALTVDSIQGMGVGCPVDLQAQRRGTGAMVQTMGQPGQAAQRLRLNWANRHGKAIVGATLVVRGFDASARVIPAGSAATPELKKTIDVKLNLSGEGKTTTDMTMRSFSTVSWIDLTSVEYADGTGWSLPTGESCTVAPDRLVLVATR